MLWPWSQQMIHPKKIRHQQNSSVWLHGFSSQKNHPFFGAPAQPRRRPCTTRPITAIWAASRSSWSLTLGRTGRGALVLGSPHILRSELGRFYHQKAECSNEMNSGWSQKRELSNMLKQKHPRLFIEQKSFFWVMSTVKSSYGFCHRFLDGFCEKNAESGGYWSDEFGCRRAMASSLDPLQDLQNSYGHTAASYAASNKHKAVAVGTKKWQSQHS